MAQAGVPLFDKTVNETHHWLREISEAMNHPDQQMAYHAMRGVLTSLRDRLSADSAAHLAAQLPTLVRGVYYEGYHPAGKPDKNEDLDKFLQRVSNDLQQAGGGNPENAARAVFSVLQHHISEGEASKITGQLPKELQSLWLH